MSFNKINKTPIIIGGLQIFSNNKIDASTGIGPFAISSVQTRNEPEAILGDLKSIRSNLQLYQSHQITSSNALMQRIIIVKKQLKILKPENILVKIIFCIFSIFFKTELETIARLESEKRTLLKKFVLVLKRRDSDQETLNQVESHIQNVSSTPHTMARKAVYASAEAFIHASKVNSVKRKLEQSLSPLIIQTTQNLVNKTFTQDPKHPKYQTKMLEQDPTPDVSIEDNGDETHVAVLKYKQSVQGPSPSEKEIVRFDSLCEVQLDRQGYIQEAWVENIVDKWSIDSRTPLQMIENEYQIPSVDDSEHFQPLSLDVNGKTLIVKVSKNFIGDCWRQIDHLKIQRMGTLASRHSDLRKKKDAIDVQYERALSGSEKPLLTPLKKQHERVKNAYSKQILEDLLTIIHEKLGSRQSLLPLVTYLFDPAAAGPLQILISSIKYAAFPYAADSGQGVHFTFTLDIPEDNEQPVRVICNGQGKIDRFHVKAVGIYTIHLDGHVAFEGSVS